MFFYLVELPFYILVKNGFSYNATLEKVKIEVSVGNNLTKYVHFGENKFAYTRYIDENESIDHQTLAIKETITQDDRTYYRLYKTKSVLSITLHSDPKGNASITEHLERNNALLKQVVTEFQKYYFATLSSYDISRDYYFLIPKSYYNSNNTATFEVDEKGIKTLVVNNCLDRDFFYPGSQLEEQDEKELIHNLETRPRIEKTLTIRSKVRNAIQFGDITSAIIYAIAYVEKMMKKALEKKIEFREQHIDSMFHKYGLMVFLDAQAPKILQEKDLKYIPDVKVIYEQRTNALHWLADIAERQDLITKCENALKLGDALYEYFNEKPIKVKILKGLMAGISLDGGKAGEELRVAPLTSTKMALMAAESNISLRSIFPQGLGTFGLNNSTRILLPEQGEEIIQAYLQEGTLYIFLVIPLISHDSLVKDFALRIAGPQVFIPSIQYQNVEFHIYAGGSIPDGIIEQFKKELERNWQKIVSRITVRYAFTREQLKKIKQLFDEKRKYPVQELVQKEDEWHFYFCRALRPVGNEMLVLSKAMRDTFNEFDLV